MKTKQRLFFSLGAVVLLVCVAYFFLKTHLSPQEFAQEQLSVSALSPQSVWDQDFLEKNPIIKNKISLLEKGELCQSLKKLDNKKLTYKDLSLQLKNMGFQCVIRPLSVNPHNLSLGYLKTDNSTTLNPHEKGVARQEICYELAHPQCVIRLKLDGFPRHKKSEPHSSKVVLIDEQEDPGKYENEAFKIGFQGQAIPKGPNQKFGFKKCPYHEKQVCEQWVDEIMTQAHPTLKEPKAPEN